MPKGDEDLALWSKGKKKINEGVRQGPSHRRVAVGRRRT
jgi:hypothetical protein